MMRLNAATVLTSLIFIVPVFAAPPATTTDLDPQAQNKPIYKANGGRTFSVAAPASTPTLVYNCNAMPLICENVAAWANKNKGNRGIHNGAPVFYFDPDQSDKESRRTASCGCFKHDECNVATSNGRYPGKKVTDIAYTAGLNPISPQNQQILLAGTNPGLDPNNNAQLAPRLPMNGVPGRFFKDGVAFSCDEFPAATWIQGGTFAETICALQSWKVFQGAQGSNGQAKNVGKWPLPSGSGQNAEQDWQALAHGILGVSFLPFRWPRNRLLTINNERDLLGSTTQKKLALTQSTLFLSLLPPSIRQQKHTWSRQQILR